MSYVPRKATGGAEASYTPASDSWVSWLRVDDLAGANNAALTTLAQSGGTASSYTGTGTLKTGVNGISGHKAISFNGTTNAFATTTGGASLTTNFYAAAVVRFVDRTGEQNVISWGNEVSGQRRSLMKFGAGLNHWLSYIGEGGPDVISTSALAQATDYFLEMWRDAATGLITLAVNGVEVKSGTPGNFNAYSSAALLLGKNPADSELFNGLLAEAFFHATPSTALRNRVRVYVQNRYGIAMGVFARLPIVQFVAHNLLGESVMLAYGSRLVVGEGIPIFTGGTGEAFDDPAAFSVLGSFSAYRRDGEHMLANSWNGQNVVSVWNQHTGGFSTVRFLQPGVNGEEMGAMGVGFLEPAGVLTYGGAFLEASNGANPTRWGEFHLVQTRFAGGSFRRFGMKENGDLEFYDQGGVLKLTLKADGTTHLILPTINPGAGMPWNNAGTIAVGT